VGRKEIRKHPVVNCPLGLVAIHHKNRGIMVIRKGLDKVLGVVGE
jgi:hypothetical protein